METSDARKAREEQEGQDHPDGKVICLCGHARDRHLYGSCPCTMTSDYPNDKCFCAGFAVVNEAKPDRSGDIHTIRHRVSVSTFDSAIGSSEMIAAIAHDLIWKIRATGARADYIDIEVTGQ